MRYGFLVTGLVGAAAIFVPILLAVRGIISFVSKFLASEDRLAYLLVRLPTSPLTRYCTPVRKTEQLINAANRPVDFSYTHVLGYKEVSVWATLVFVGVMWLSSYPLGNCALVLMCGLAFSLRWPEMYLKRAALRSRSRAKRQLPRVIDLMQVYVLAGYNLEQSIEKVSVYLAGEWGGVFKEAALRISMGLPFDDVFTERAMRLDSDFNKFVAALKLARRLGVRLSQTLEVQSTLIRARRVQETESAARRASVLIALPLVVCIFPALLILYLAPAVLNVIGLL